MERFAAPDGRMLAYRDEGPAGADTLPVLCLAGLSRNSRDFDSLAAHLAPHRRVIRLDSRGRGQSDRATEPLHEYTIPTEVGDVLALIQHLKLGQVIIVGTSRGGILGLSIAAARPGLLAGLVLNDIGAVVEGRGLLRILATLGSQPGVATFEEAAAKLAAMNAAQFPGVPLSRWITHAHAVYVPDASGHPHLSYDHHLRAAAAAAFDMELPHIDLWPLFEAAMPLPMLLLRGANSDILSAETAAKMQRQHANLAWVEVANRGHVPFLDEPEAVAAIDDFLLGLKASQPSEG
ncbi:MAG: alpha/beta hydrolase [Pseudomonadota bacterium]